ncbi:nose resistant to fluoxetine protein 6-like isoform X2 [Tachypleus tridentatus]
MSNKSEVYFRGQYCTVDVRPPLPPKPHYYTVHHRLEMFENSSDSFKILTDVSNKAHVFYFLSLRLGLCIPSTCSARDLEQFIQKLVEDYGFLVSVSHCEIYEPMHVDNAELAVISVISLMAFFVFAASIFDILCRFCLGQKSKENKTPPGTITKIILAFSAYTNIGKLLDTRTSLEGLRSLHGVRFVSMMWIICGNIFLSMKYQIFRQLIRAIAVSESFAFQPFLNCTLALDTFFFISGFLATYTVLRRETSMKVFSNPLLLFFHRIYRLIPAHMVVVALTILFPLVGGGPVWSEILDPLITNCRERWWTNLLFVNNFVVSAEYRCLEHSWYVSCEAQLLLVAVGVLLLIKRLPRFGVLVIIGLIILCITITAVLTVYYVLPPTVLFAQADLRQRLQFEDIMYHKPYIHLGAYCVGMYLGYAIAKRSHIILKPYILVFGWIAAVACNLAVVFGVYYWNEGNEIIEAVDAFIYAATHRTVWALGIGWLTFVCVTGNGGIVNKILSWRAWIPLGRITFLTYLIHPLVQMTLVAHVKERLQADQYVAVYLFSGLLLASLTMASFLSVLVDMPFRELEKVVVSTFRKCSKSEQRKESIGSMKLGSRKISTRDKETWTWHPEEVINNPVMENQHVD